MRGHCTRWLIADEKVPSLRGLTVNFLVAVGNGLSPWNVSDVPLESPVNSAGSANSAGVIEDLTLTNRSRGHIKQPSRQNPPLATQASSSHSSMSDALQCRIMPFKKRFKQWHEELLQSTTAFRSLDHGFTPALVDAQHLDKLQGASDQQAQHLVAAEASVPHGSQSHTYAGESWGVSSPGATVPQRESEWIIGQSPSRLESCTLAEEEQPGSDGSIKEGRAISRCTGAMMRQLSPSATGESSPHTAAMDGSTENLVEEAASLSRRTSEEKGIQLSSRDIIAEKSWIDLTLDSDVLKGKEAKNKSQDTDTTTKLTIKRKTTKRKKEVWNYVKAKRRSIEPKLNRSSIENSALARASHKKEYNISSQRFREHMNTLQSDLKKFPRWPYTKNCTFCLPITQLHNSLFTACAKYVKGLDVKPDTEVPEEGPVTPWFKELLVFFNLMSKRAVPSLIKWQQRIFCLSNGIKDAERRLSTLTLSIMLFGIVMRNLSDADLFTESSIPQLRTDAFTQESNFEAFCKCIDRALAMDDYKLDFKSGMLLRTFFTMGLDDRR